MPASRKVVLVTGATGFIGSHLVRRLLREPYEVHVWFREPRSAWRLRDVWKSLKAHQVDITDQASVQGSVSAIRPHLVFHLAAFRDTRRKWENCAAAMRTNLLGTIHLTSALRDADSRLQAMVYAGSSEEYGDGHAPFLEDIREAPVSPYSASKTAATHFCQMLARSFGFPVIVLRPFLTYGPAQDADMFIPSLIHHCLGHEDFPMTSGDQLREFNYVDDVVEAFSLAAKNPSVAGSIVNIGNGRPYTIREVAERIQRMMSHPIRLLPGTLAKRPGESALFCDNARARQLLGWEPQVGLEEGLSKTIQWYRLHPGNSLLESETPIGR